MNKKFRDYVGEGARDRGSLSLHHILWFLLILLLLTTAACGRRMTPYAPDMILPAPVRNFQLTQEGDALVLSWQLPRKNLLGQPLIEIEGCRVFRAVMRGVSPELLSSSDFSPYADIDLAYPRQGEVHGESVLLRDRDLAPDHRYYYRVAAYNQDGYNGGWSQTLSYAWGWLPRTPENFKAVAGDKIVNLSWSPVTKLQNGAPILDLAGYLIYRRSGGKIWIRVTPAPIRGNKFQDLAVLNDVDYTYRVNAVRHLGGDLLASLNSTTQTVMPQKTTPPPPVTNFFAVPTAQGVELRWELSPAPDVAGYRIYRRLAGQEHYILLTPKLLQKPYFVDTQVSRGQTYNYYVTAVDNTPRANESLPSEVASITY